MFMWYMIIAWWGRNIILNWASCDIFEELGEVTTPVLGIEFEITSMNMEAIFKSLW